MDVFKYAKLVLDEPRDIFYSGQVLNGHIECEVTEPLSYTVINANFVGEANVFWTELETEEYNGVQRSVNVKYTGRETYFNTMLCISGGSGVITLPPGTHKVPFQFQIPHNAPSSFNGDRGSITYKVVTYIEYPDPSRERDQLEKAFEVVAPLNLNIGNDIKAPIDLEFEEAYSCCCSSSPLTIRVHIPASGFCPGQAIPITVDADNESNVEVKKITFELIQKECYHSIEPKSDYIPPHEILETVQTGPILSGTSRENTYELVVPEFIAPNLQNCNVIDVGYSIYITIKLSGCNDDLEDESEICLGLVPLASLVQNYTHPMQSDLPQSPIPDPNFVLAPPVQNMQYQMSAPIQNSTAYPTASPFPTHGALPAVTPYPNNTQSIPMATLKTGNIGFVAPNSPPYPGGHNAPYPATNGPHGTNNSPYPGGNNAPYPGANTAPYPGGNTAPYPGANTAPYPGGNSAPYPGANTAPYPGGNTAPYPGGNTAPYPGANNAPYPGGNTAPYPGGNTAPYPGANNAPYPGGNTAPYPGGNTAPYPGANNAPYPGGNTAPYPGGNTAPYPGANNAPYPGGNTAPYPGGNTAPYPGANNAPYLGANTTPYPGSNTAPYPGTNTSPYPGANNAQYGQPAHQGYPPTPYSSAPSAPPS